jgi:uncharacterized membrane protein/PKD repeat protein
VEPVARAPEPEILWRGGYLEPDGTIALSIPYGNYMTQPIAADLDNDGTPELILMPGPSAYAKVLRAIRTDGTIFWTTDFIISGLNGVLSRVSVADLDADGKPEIIGTGWLEYGNIRLIFAVSGETGEILWRHYFPENSIARCSETPCACSSSNPCPEGETCQLRDLTIIQLSRPAIADLDGDGAPEIVAFVRDLVPFQEKDYLIALESEPASEEDPQGLRKEMWRTVTMDHGGDPPAVSAADLNGDGSAEVLWNGDQSGFTIFDGKTGNILYRDMRARSPSGHDYPVAADVDADGHLEVITGTYGGSSNEPAGFYVFGDDFGWTSGRSIWNQQDYRITNVNDDLSIPEVEPESWLFHNTYLCQEVDPKAQDQTSLEILHELGPAVSFLIEDITPAPDEVTGQNILWTDTVFDATTHFYSVPVEIPGLQPGESLIISEATTVSGNLELSGNSIPFSIPLGPVVVYAPHIIGIEPEIEQVAAGEAAEYTVRLQNLRDVDETFALEVLGIDPTYVSISSPVTVTSGETLLIPLEIKTSIATAPGIIPFYVVAAGDQGTNDQAAGGLEVAVNPLLLAAGNGVVVEAIPSDPTIGPGTEKSIRVIVSNTGREVQTYDLSAALPSGISGVFQEPQLEVAPGLTAGKETIFVLSVPIGTPAGQLPFVISAEATDNPYVTDEAECMLTVSDLGVIVDLTPVTAEITPPQSATFQASITNTGTTGDTYDLVVGGPLVPFAEFSTNPVTIAPGESQNVQITVANPQALLQQHTLLIIQATSQTDPQISATDASVVDILAFRDIAAEIDPAEVEITTSETGTYYLNITNLGNAGDERYIIEYSSIPEGVTLTPQSTQFLVPPMKTARIPLYVTALDDGIYLLQVKVTTDTNNQLCPPLPPAETAVQAVLIVNNVPPVADADGPHMGYEGSPITFDGSGSIDTDGSISSYEWDLDYDGITFDIDSTLQNPSKTWFDDYTGTVALRVIDDDGDVSSIQTTTVTVENIAPTVDAGSDKIVYQGEVVAFSGSFTDPGVDTHIIEWNFGDGESATGTLTPTHIYEDYGDYTVTLTVTDDDSGVGTDSLSITVIPYGEITPYSEVTTSSLCYFDINPETEDQDFKLIFTQDPQDPSRSTYKLTASNPGQLYYNVFHIGTPGDSVTLDIKVPYPFVTQGAVPIHIYTGVDIAGECFVPLDEIGTSNVQITLESYDAQEFGEFAIISFTEDVPASGLIYITVHLDYGLKKITGFTPIIGDVNNDARHPGQDGQLYTTDDWFVYDKAEYTFSYAASGSAVDARKIYNLNTFKKQPGFAGLVTDDTGTPVPNVKVEIIDPEDKLMATVYTDEDGFYSCVYKHKGKESVYMVGLPDYGLEQEVDLKANKFVEVNFQIT